MATSTPDSDPSLSTKSMQVRACGHAGICRLAGKVAIITGGASGIGAASARLFVAHGARVAIADVQDTLGQSLAASLSPHAVFFHCDVTHEPDVALLVDSTVRHFCRLDIMFSNAGILGPFGSALEDLDIAAFDRVFAVNVRGAVLCTKHAARAMIPQKRGVILATSSVASVLGGVGPLAYAVSKSALVGVVRNASYELGKHGIRVNCVSPSGLPSPMTRCFVGVGVEDGRKDEELAVKFSEPGDLKGVMLMAEDVARAALFLTSDEAQYVSGHDLVVDGGFTVSKGYIALDGEQQ